MGSCPRGQFDECPHDLDIDPDRARYAAPQKHGHALLGEDVGGRSDGGRLCLIQLKHEVRREALDVPFNLLDQAFRPAWQLARCCCLRRMELAGRLSNPEFLRKIEGLIQHLS